MFNALLLIFLFVLVEGQDIELRLAYPACIYCAPARDSVVGQWSEWSDWSLCRDYYGISSQTRTRTCINGNRCPGGDAQEARQCLEVARDPPQNTWTEWSSWNECSGARQTRTRGCKCDRAVDLNGCNCNGTSFEERDCSNTAPLRDPCVSCQPSPCAQCPPNYALPCYTCSNTPTLGGR